MGVETVTMKYKSMSEVEEKDDGGREREGRGKGMLYLKVSSIRAIRGWGVGHEVEK